MTVGELELTPEASSASRARHFVEAWLISHRLSSLVDTAVLLTSEVVTNALLHVTGSAHLEVHSVPDGLRVEVSDSSPVGPARRRHSPLSATGRGLGLLDQLSAEWGWRPTREGKTVWFTVTTAHDPWGAFASLAEAGE